MAPIETVEHADRSEWHALVEGRFSRRLLAGAAAARAAAA